MADTTKRAEIILAMKDELTAASSEAVDQLKQINEGIRDLSKSTEDNKSTMSGWQMTMIAVNQGLEIGQKAVEAFKKVWEFSKEGAAIQRIGAQFKATAEEAGMDADRLLASMDKAAHGTVDDEELMQAATRSLTQGVIKNADDMTKFMEIARASSVRFGGDTAQAFQQIMYATEVGAQRTLKATIGVVDFQKAYDDLAAKLGKRKQDLTDEEQLQARVNAVLEKGADLVKKVGDAGEDAATKMQRFETRVTNLGDELKTGATNSLLPYLDGFDLLEKSLNENMNSVTMLQSTYQYMADRFGENSQQAQFLKQQLDKATEAEARLAQTTEEQAVRAGMKQISVLSQQTTVMTDNNAATRAYANQLLYNVEQYQAQQKAAEEAAAAQREYRSTIADVTGKLDSMAQSLARTNDMQAKQMLAQSQLQTLKSAYEEGKLSQEGYQQATDAVLLRYDLTTPKALAMAKAQDTLNKAFESGNLSLDDYIAAGDKLPKMAADGEVSMKELAALGVKPTTEALKDQAAQLDLMGEAWKRLPKQVETVYKIRVEGEIPSLPGNPTTNARAGGGPVEPLQAYTVGENGPETLLMGSVGGYVVPHARGGGRQSGGEISVMVKVEAGAFQFMGVTAADAELITARVSQQLAAKMRSVISNPVGVT